MERIPLVVVKNGYRGCQDEREKGMGDEWEDSQKRSVEVDAVL